MYEWFEVPRAERHRSAVINGISESVRRRWDDPGGTKRRSQREGREVV